MYKTTRKFLSTQSCQRLSFVVIPNDGVVLDRNGNKICKLSCFFIAIHQALLTVGKNIPVTVLRQQANFSRRSIQLDTLEHSSCIQRLCDIYSLNVSIYTSNYSYDGSKGSHWIANPAMEFKCVTHVRNNVSNFSIVYFGNGNIGHYELIVSGTPTSPDITNFFNMSKLTTYSYVPVTHQRSGPNGTCTDIDDLKQFVCSDIVDDIVDDEEFQIACAISMADSINKISSKTLSSITSRVTPTRKVCTIPNDVTNDVPSENPERYILNLYKTHSMQVELCLSIEKQCQEIYKKDFGNDQINKNMRQQYSQLLKNAEASANNILIQIQSHIT